MVTWVKSCQDYHKGRDCLGFVVECVLKYQPAPIKEALC